MEETDAMSFASSSEHAATGSSRLTMRQPHRPPWTPSPASSPSSSPERSFYPHHPRSLSGIAVRSFALGLCLATGIILTVALLLLTDSPFWRLAFYLACVSASHFLEFWATATYNPSAADVNAFLLTSNGAAYWVSHTAAVLEFLTTNLLLPLLHHPHHDHHHHHHHPSHNSSLPSLLHSPTSLLLPLGLLLVLAGQTIRTAAMVQAGPSFNHTVQQRRAATHALVTSGVYGRLRHPSYFGYFWWALGTQLVLGNALVLCVFAGVLWRFFARRVAYEETTLVAFFGDEYVRYRARVGVGIPLIR